MDFHELINEAISSVYDPRAKRCWLFHSWSMWDLDGSETWQIRRCVNCGVRQYKKIKQGCAHQWKEIRSGALVQDADSRVVLGYFHDQKCVNCGALRHIELRSGASRDAVT